MINTVRIDMHGRVALVTGGGYGMGRATSLRFAQCGAAVVVAGMTVARPSSCRHRRGHGSPDG